MDRTEEGRVCYFQFDHNDTIKITGLNSSDKFKLVKASPILHMKCTNILQGPFNGQCLLHFLGDSSGDIRCLFE